MLISNPLKPSPADFDFFTNSYGSYKIFQTLPLFFELRGIRDEKLVKDKSSSPTDEERGGDGGFYLLRFFRSPRDETKIKGKALEDVWEPIWN